ncbi:hypothetical protein SIID45300_01122 [Candidatus Magnetaquicoccaceae bacterium FCR-1]|uniref:Peptidase S74 domain-containing protein n=1 Tax=Candidatus Magnetaquiglobus chichijimensis TaxID=3141448 RepID=A0ABQ0C7Y1_9PROT
MSRFEFNPMTGKLNQINDTVDFGAAFRGFYDAVTVYAVGDAVMENGLIYVCRQVGNGHAPATSGEYWQKLALQGPQGPQGVQGEPGDPGETGPQGLAGPSGAMGPQGPQGEAGPQGVQGDVGPQGAQGAQGAQGVQGDPGPQGAQGAIGPQGPQGATGPQGIPGPQRWYQGSGVPSDAIGAQFDLYLRGDNGQVYIKGVSTWSDAGINIKGPTGIGSGGVNNLTSGGVVFGAPDGLIAQDPATLHYDAVNKRLGFGTSSPSTQLCVRSTGAVPSEKIVPSGLIGDLLGASFSSITNGATSWSSNTNYSNTASCAFGFSLSSQRNITKFRFYNSQGNGDSLIKHFRVEYYTGSAWVKVSITGWEDNATQSATDEAEAAFAAGWNTVTFSAVSCSQFRVYATSKWNGGIYAFITEMEIYGEQAGLSSVLLDLTSAGLLGLNTLAPSARLDINNPSDILTLRAYRSGTTATDPIAEFSSDVTALASVKCRILNNGNLQNTNNSYGAISDEKFKENIADTAPKLADLMAVRVRNFNLIGNPLRQIGVIAQEVETVFPGLVESVPDFETIPDPAWSPGEGETEADRPIVRRDLGTVTKSVKYSVFVPILIKALQESQTRVVALATELNALTVRIEALESV